MIPLQPLHVGLEYLIWLQRRTWTLICGQNVSFPSGSLRPEQLDVLDKNACIHALGGCSARLSIRIPSSLHLVPKLQHAACNARDLGLQVPFELVCHGEGFLVG